MNFKLVPPDDTDRNYLLTVHKNLCDGIDQLRNPDAVTPDLKDIFSQSEITTSLSIELVEETAVTLALEKN